LFLVTLLYFYKEDKVNRILLATSMIHFFLLLVLLLSINPMLFGKPKGIPEGEKNILLSTPVNLNDSNTTVLTFQHYTPSVLLRKGQIELKTFHNLYTQHRFFDRKAHKVNSLGRTSYYTSIHEGMVGVNKMLNAGLVFWHKGVLAHQSDDLAFEALWTKEGKTSNKAPLYLGPRLKIAPFSSLPNLSIQSTFLVALQKNPEGINEERLFLETNRNLWINQFFYDRKLGTHFRLFAQFVQWVSFPKDPSFVEDPFIETPLSAFLNYLFSKRVNWYVQSEYWGSHRGMAFSSYFFQAGSGVKYQLISNVLEIELLYTNFLLGSLNQGAGETYNLGLRWIR
jgi:hypothetical protein